MARLMALMNALWMAVLMVSLMDLSRVQLSVLEMDVKMDVERAV